MWAGMDDEKEKKTQRRRTMTQKDKEENKRRKRVHKNLLSFVIAFRLVLHKIYVFCICCKIVYSCDI